jgi:hypothetical protein
MRRLLPILALLLIPAALHARDLELFVGARGAYTLSHGFVDQFDTHRVASPHVGVAFEFLPDWLLEVSYASSHAGGTVFSSFTTDWYAHAAQLGVRYSWPVLSWLRPYGRVTGGVTFERYRLQGPVLDLKARQVGFEVTPLVGVELLWPTDALATADGLFQKATGGVYFELGYRYARPFDVGSRVPSGGFEGASGVPLGLGTFDVQGFVFGGGFIGHF